MLLIKDLYREYENSLISLSLYIFSTSADKEILLSIEGIIWVLGSYEEKDRKELAKKKADAFSKSATSNEEKISLVNDHLPVVEDIIIKSYDDIINSNDNSDNLNSDFSFVFSSSISKSS